MHMRFESFSKRQRIDSNGLLPAGGGRSVYGDGTVPALPTLFAGNTHGASNANAPVSVTRTVYPIPGSKATHQIPLHAYCLGRNIVEPVTLHPIRRYISPLVMVNVVDAAAIMCSDFIQEFNDDPDEKPLDEIDFQKEIHKIADRWFPTGVCNTPPHPHVAEMRTEPRMILSSATRLGASRDIVTFVQGDVKCRNYWGEGLRNNDYCFFVVKFKRLDMEQPLFTLSDDETVTCPRMVNRKSRDGNRDIAPIYPVIVPKFSRNSVLSHKERTFKDPNGNICYGKVINVGMCVENLGYRASTSRSQNCDKPLLDGTRIHKSRNIDLCTFVSKN